MEEDKPGWREPIAADFVLPNRDEEMAELDQMLRKDNNKISLPRHLRELLIFLGGITVGVVVGGGAVYYFCTSTPNYPEKTFTSVDSGFIDGEK